MAPTNADSAAQPFNDGWCFRRDADSGSEVVTLPHDAMMGEGRRADAPSGWDGAYFLGGLYHYHKVWRVPANLRGRQLHLRFEGVFRHSTVKVNGVEVGGCNSGYVGFQVRIDNALNSDPAADNLIEVRVDNRGQPSSRWYTGSGIYRPVWLVVSNAVDISPHGIVFRTLSLDDLSGLAKVSVSLTLDNADAKPVDVLVLLTQGSKEIARQMIHSKEAEVETVLCVPNAQLWSSETPHLYDLCVRVGDPGLEHHLRVGIRTLEYSAQTGMRVNGKEVLLRGACIHHDGGK